MVALRGLDEACAELGSGPVELARIDDDSTDGRSVTSNPLGSRLDNDVRTELDGANQVASTAEGVLWERV